MEKSFSSDNSFPSYNPNYPNTPIGAYSPLVGQRPFRRAPHTGYYVVTYARPRWYMQITGVFVGRRDDSTFLTDANGGTTLLLPNQNLDPAYQTLGLTANYRINRHVFSYTVIDNLLSQHYQQVLGYPALPFNFRTGMQISLGRRYHALRIAVSLRTALLHHDANANFACLSRSKTSIPVEIACQIAGAPTVSNFDND